MAATTLCLTANWFCASRAAVCPKLSEFGTRVVSRIVMLRAAAGERPAEGRAATTRLTPWLNNLPTMAGQTEVAVLCSRDFPA
jgi:hypothetical protein